METRVPLRPGVALLSALLAACSSSSSSPDTNDAATGADGGAEHDGSTTTHHDAGGGSKDAGAMSDAGHAKDGAHAGDTGADSGAPGTDTGAPTCTPGTPGTATGVVAGMVAGPGTVVSGCAIFPPGNAWNVDVSASSIATTTKYTGIPQGTHLHPDLGGWTSSGPYGIPYNVVPASQANEPITFNLYADESDPGPGGWTTSPSGGTGVTAYPVPNNAEIEGAPANGQIAGDDHLLILQQGSDACGPCTLWETWQTAGGTMPPWTAANGAKWDLGSNALRPLGYTSADAAGLSVFAGLLRIAEVKAGTVTHAIRVTFNTTQAGYVYPATHFAGSSALGSSDPPMGLHLRLKASFDTSGFSGPGLIVATGMKTYGLIIADIGSDWFFQGDSDNGWDDMDPAGSDTYVGELITDFGKVTGADFDVLDTGAPVDTGE